MLGVKTLAGEEESGKWYLLASASVLAGEGVAGGLRRPGGSTRISTGAPLFLANDEDAADPQGDADLPGWHQMSTFEAIRKASTLTALTDLFDWWGVLYAVNPGEHRLIPVLEEFH